MPLHPPPSVVALFHASGWQGGHAAVSAPGCHPAEAVLREFGGLSVGRCGAGEECAAGDIVFGRNPEFEQYPELREWSRELDSVLVNLGELHHGHGALFMDEQGFCYGLSLVHEAFWLQGGGFADAVERILLGRKGRPMFLPAETSISWFGETIGRAHPSAWHPAMRTGDSA